MFIWDLLIALLVALLFVGLLVGLVGWGRRDRTATTGTTAATTPRGEGSSAAAWGVILFLFVILFLGIWAGGVWIEPFGPEAWGVAWLPFLFVGLILALVVAAAAPPVRRTPTTGRAATRQVGPVGSGPGSEPAPEKARHERQGEALAVSFGVFFWLLVGLFVLAVFFAYL